MSSRDLNKATPKMREFAQKFIAECARRGIHIDITCVSRDIYEQTALYAQGRKTLEEVNALRKIAGLPAIGKQDNSYSVTWTLNSLHVVNPHNNNPGDDLSRAIDFVVVNGKEYTWNLKADINKNNIPDYEEIGKIAKEVDPSIIWGGSFKNKDYPHFQEKV